MVREISLGEYVPSYTFYDSVGITVGIYIKEFNFKMIFIRQVNITEYMQGRAKRVYHMTVMLDTIAQAVNITGQDDNKEDNNQNQENDVSVESDKSHRGENRK